jgi:hypothetical protein
MITFRIFPRLGKEIEKRVALVLLCNSEGFLLFRFVKELKTPRFTRR